MNLAHESRSRSNSELTKSVTSMMHRDASTSRTVGIIGTDDSTNSAETYDEDATDQPIDYSKEYIEMNAAAQNRLDEASRRNGASRVSKKDFDGERGATDKVDLYGDYAETDLDQPTDYSLRYAEDDTDEDEKQNTEYFHGSVQEDTIKTYCTEGTPYETPFNFSTATSMSDLRLEDGKENLDLMKKLPKKALEVVGKVPTLTFVKQTDSLDCAEPDNDVLVTKEENPKDTAILNPGQVTPEKIVSYYEEETHGFSRANSLSSLSSAVTPQNNIPGVMSKVDLPASESKDELGNDDQNIVDHNQVESPLENNSAENKRAATSDLLDKEGKMVKFSSRDYYAEETPLMFSRCSSLGSLSGFEQHSIHDDHSSVVSDFSRRTSGAVSPSELPDSPTQTVLPSPRNHKTQNAEFMSKIQGEAVRPSVRHLSFSKPQVGRSSVFEDAVATFKVELTPIEFSTTTSLSSLTIDDIKIPDDTKAHDSSEKTTDTNEKDINQLETDMLNMTINKSQNKTKEEQMSDGDEDDEDMLAACINVGMQTSRYRQSFNSQKSTQSEQSDILVSYQRNSVSNRLESHATPVETSIGASKTNRPTIETVASDTVHVYCTEDTPADISPVGSQTNLSALSMPSVQEDIETIEPDKPVELDCHRNDSFDESSNLSGEDEKILNECIKSGMPKTRQITPPSINGLSFVKKPETLPHKFNIYATPSSSPVEINHGNKNPILGKLSGNASLPHLDEFLEDSPNQSDDEAILTECIESAMPKVAKFNASSSFKPQTINNSKGMNTRMSSPASSIFFQPGYREQRKPPTKKLSPFEDNVGLSEEEEDIMLAQCIRSGMPKASSSMSITTTSAKKPVLCLNSKTTGNVPVSSPSYFTNKPYSGAIKKVAPHSSSLYRSTNVNSVDMRFARNALGYNCFPGKSTSSAATQITSEMLRNCDTTINNTPYYVRRSSSLPSSHHNQHHQHHQHYQHQHHQHHYYHHHHAESENGNRVDGLVCMSMQPRVRCVAPVVFNRTEHCNDYSCRNPMKSNAEPPRYNSASCLHEDGSPMISTDEWPLVGLCITSGLPRNKYRVRGIKAGNESAIPGGHDDCEPIPEDNYSVCSYNSYVCKT